MRRRKQKSKTGFTLIEILLAALIIAILVIGGSATMYYTGSNINIQGNRRIALELANQRLEHARKNYYYSIVPPVFDLAGSYFLTADNDNPYLLVLNNSKKTETVPLDGINYEMVTEVIRHSSTSGTINFNPECLQVIVNVEYRSSTGQDVEVSTLILPPEVTE